MTTGRPSSAARLAHSCASPCLVVSTYSADSRSTRLRTSSRVRAILPRLAAGLRITRGLLEGVVVSIAVLLHKATIFAPIVSSSLDLYNYPAWVGFVLLLHVEAQREGLTWSLSFRLLRASCASLESLLDQGGYSVFARVPDSFPLLASSVHRPSQVLPGISSGFWAGALSPRWIERDRGVHGAVEDLRGGQRLRHRLPSGVPPRVPALQGQVPIHGNAPS